MADSSPVRSRGVKRKRSRRSKIVLGPPVNLDPVAYTYDDNYTPPDEDALLLAEDMTKADTMIKRPRFSHNMTWERILPHITQILWFGLFISCFIGISMMPAKYMVLQQRYVGGLLFRGPRKIVSISVLPVSSVPKTIPEMTTGELRCTILQSSMSFHGVRTFTTVIDVTSPITVILNHS